jgi:glycosyltransferase involved in cell wall biosynthesis
MQTPNKDRKESVSLPFVSVIIPVYNDAESLERCLDALEKQSYPQTCFEVIVVDNNSEADISLAVEQYKPNVFTFEKQPGSFAARNKGISLAKGDIFAFTDSDCIPASDWIERGVFHILKKPDSGLVGGRIELFFRNPTLLSAVEVYEKVKGFNQQYKIEKYHHCVTANLFTRREILDAVGHFDATLKSGGDVQWGQRVHASGYELIYADDVCIAHPACYTLEELCAKTARVVGGISDWKGRRRYSILKIIIDLIKLAGKVFGLIRRLIQNLSPSEKLSGKKQKVQYILMVIFVGLVRLFERIRLSLGGLSRR